MLDLESRFQNFQANLINLIYPIGSIYMSVNDVSPQIFLGGTWEQIQDRFLLSSGSTYTAGSTGGEASHTLSVNETPSHSHTISTSNAFVKCMINGDYANYNVGGTLGGWGVAIASANNQGQARLAVGGKTESAGSGSAHNNMPPYLTVYMWKRIS